MKTTNYTVCITYSMIISAVNEDEAIAIASDLEMPKGYVVDSFEANVTGREK